MLIFLSFAVLIAAVYPESVGPCMVESLLDLLYNDIDCSHTHVLPFDIQFILYTRRHQHNGVLLNTGNLNAVNPQSRVIFIIHGWMQSGSQKWITQMKDIYLNNEDCNIIIVDWSDYSNRINYGTSFCAVPQVGIFTGDFIYNLLVCRQINLIKTQINGCSLGGHIAGYAGQQIQKKTGGLKIGKIIGLDAAGPGFLNLPEDNRLDASDAMFVQGIHTSNSQFGYTDNYGTVDFHVNCASFLGCGVLQPGCPFLPGISSGKAFTLKNFLSYFFCSHIRAVAYFIESMNSTKFIGSKCGSCCDFQDGLCKFSPTAIMGEYCPPSASGQMLLNTNWEPPFALGIAGIPD